MSGSAKQKTDILSLLYSSVFTMEIGNELHYQIPRRLDRLSTIEIVEELVHNIYFFYVDIRHWPMQIYYMKVININTVNNYLQSG